jgi:hypothetical protein
MGYNRIFGLIWDLQSLLLHAKLLQDCSFLVGEIIATNTTYSKDDIAELRNSIITSICVSLYTSLFVISLHIQLLTKADLKVDFC